MNITILCFNPITDLPPAVHVIKTLNDRGHTLNIVTLAPEPDSETIFTGRERINFHFILESRHLDVPTIGKSLIEKSVLKLRNITGRFRQSRALKKGLFVVDRLTESADLVWVLHEMTPVLLKYHQILKPYFFSIYEIDDDIMDASTLMKDFARHAQRVFVPEYNRAYIIQALWGLDKVPVVMPNKPYELSETNFIETEYFQKVSQLESKNQKDPFLTPEQEEKLKAIEGKKIVLYAGIFIKERSVKEFLQAVETLGDNYVCVLLGPRTHYLDKILEKASERVIYMGYIVPYPNHLRVIQKAFIGVLVNINTSNKSLSAVYYAPNKVYEYAKFGIPMICNDMPGIRYQVAGNNMGVCCENLDVDSIVSAIKKVESGYHTMRQNALKFYGKQNTNDILIRAVEEAAMNSPQ